MKVGIDSLTFDVPKLHLPIKILAENRNIEPEKLIKGLGLYKMTFPDVHQDVVTFAANAVYKLIQQEQLNPSEIARIYIGTESGVDSSKPVASYVSALIEQQLGHGALRHCDTLDMTFACIGAVDALQNSLDFIRLNPTKKAIVVAGDTAKYDLDSTGEYTQGAGAIAMLITANPRVISFTQEVGVSSKGVFDFFKPRRSISKNELLNTVDNPEWNGILENEITFYKEQPVFDGQYSNQCYISRITEAYAHYKEITQQNEILFHNWENILMHLPYCFQARRTFIEIYASELKLVEDTKTLSKSPEYLELVHQKIMPSERASGQVGNIYTGSIFLGLLSTLCHHFQNQTDVIGRKLGFIAYGSGSKSKVFEGQIESEWQSVIQNIPLFETLDTSHEIDFETYLALHKKEQKTSIVTPNNEFVLQSIERENPFLLGARYYEFV